jgi:hypothetical protein
MARLIVEFDGLLIMLMGVGKIAEIKAGGAGSPMSDQGLRAIRPGRGFAHEQLGHFGHRCRFAAGQMPHPKTVIGGEPFRGVFHPARQFAGARKGRRGLRRGPSLRPDQRITKAGLEVNAALAQCAGALDRLAFRERCEKGLCLGEFGELLGRREALDRRRQHSVGVGVAIVAAIELRQRQRGAQFEAPRFLQLRDGDRGLQRLLVRRGIGRVAVQQDLGANAVHFGFVPTGLGRLQLGECLVQAPEPGISLAGTRFGFGQRRFETGQEPIPTLLPSDGKAASHLGECRLLGAVTPLCPASKKYREASSKDCEIVAGDDIGQRLAIGRDRFGVAANKPQSRRKYEHISHRWNMRCRLGVC